MLLVGADPELFVRNEDKFVSGHKFPCGTKAKPRKTDHGSVQVDGIALEFNVIPSASKNEFVLNLKNALGDLNAIVARCLPGSRLEAIPTAEVGEEFLKKVPKLNRELGCNPDYNAYTMMKNEVPDASFPFRTGSGHVHVGFCAPDDKLLDDHAHFLKCARIVRQLDYFLGLPSLSWDDDVKRRALYGKAGAFRPKPYGVEYRVLSNKWVDNEKLAGFVFDQTEKAMNLIEQDLDLATDFGAYAMEAINEGRTHWLQERPDIAELVLG